MLSLKFVLLLVWHMILECIKDNMLHVRINVFIGAPLLTNFTHTFIYEEGPQILEINFEVGPRAHPFPVFEWAGSPGVTIQNDTRRTFGYPSASFKSFHRSDTGMYTLTATNRFLDEPRDVYLFGSASGSFTLNILCKLIIYFYF